MTTFAKVVLGAGGIAVAVALYATMRQAGPARGSREWQIQQFRTDLGACSKFASKREEARRLLAWKPEPPWVNPPGTDAWRKEFEARLRQKSEEAQANLLNLDAELAALAYRFEADENACLQDLGWPEVQIQTLRKEVTQTTKKK